MDQLKDILRQAILYRFWIAVGLAALLPIVAYAMGSGAIKEKAKAETDKIQNANKEVRQYGSGTIPNAQYKPIVDEKKDELVKDINASWKKLYDRQAPLLTWPQNVEARFRAWERKWPENVDPREVTLAIVEYITEYRNFVGTVYKSFHPFDPDPASKEIGVVVAPPQDALLRPFPFDISNPPDLGKIWAAQERLWTQRTLLEVIADVNKSAKDWNAATIKQINLLEVGDAASQDQRSLAKGETLTEAPAINNPAAPAPAAPAPGSPEPGGGAMPGSNPMGQQNAETVYYIGTNPQFKVLPFALGVLIEQDRIQDLLVTLENSPMAIQVMEVEMAKPGARVTKPVKGQSMNFYGGGMMEPSSSMVLRMPGNRQIEAYGGQRSMPGSYGGGRPGGVDKRGGDSRRKLREAEAKAFANAATPTIHDPYFNIVEVKVYGQARFYNPPPPEAAPAPGATGSPGAPATPEATPPAAPGEAAKAEAPKAEGEAPKAEAPKAEAPASAPAPAPAPPGGEAPKAESPAAPTPK